MLEARLRLEQPLSQVFHFFADAANLEAITPPWLRFRILTPLPLEMRTGALFDYRLRLHGIPLTWRAEITLYDPPQRFVDEQRRGPYRRWHHEHRFHESAQGTWIEDRVAYRLWGGRPVHSLLVRPQLERIFRFRQQRVRALLGAADPRG